MTKGKDPKRQMQGRIAQAKGRRFEDRLDAAFDYYRQKGLAVIEKTPEPMRIVKSIGNGKFIAYFTKKAQPDYQGTVQGGQSVVFEAKFTSTDRIEQSRVKQSQSAYMDRQTRLGTRCYVLSGFESGGVYCVPWEVWTDMKQRFGRKYVTEADLEEYRVRTARNGMLLLLD